jgi:hypothetical protein
MARLRKNRINVFTWKAIVADWVSWGINFEKERTGK